MLVNATNAQLSKEGIACPRGRKYVALRIGSPRSWSTGRSRPCPSVCRGCNASPRACAVRGSRPWRHAARPCSRTSITTTRIYSHNQLYGVWKIARRGKLPRTNALPAPCPAHRDAFGVAVQRLGYQRLARGTTLVMHPFLARIGPDLLAPDLTWQRYRRRGCDDPRFAGAGPSVRCISISSFLAGSGQLPALRNPLLLRPAIPASRPGDLTRGERADAWPGRPSPSRGAAMKRRVSR
jgi:hypothetical protein